MSRPQLLLVPWITELEWRVKPLLDEWADVASYDAPGVGDEPVPDPLDPDALIAHGLAAIDRHGWDRCVIVSDEFAVPIAVAVASARPEAVAGLALGHASLSYSESADNPGVSPEVLAGFNKLLETDYRAWVRAYTQITQGAYDDETMERFLERVPREVCKRHNGVVDELTRAADIEALLRQLQVPMLFAGHEDCIVFSSEGYQEAVAAFPEARTITTHEKPSCSPAFAEALRSFCEELLPAQVVGR